MAAKGDVVKKPTALLQKFEGSSREIVISLEGKLEDWVRGVRVLMVKLEVAGSEVSLSVAVIAHHRHHQWCTHTCGELGTLEFLSRRLQTSMTRAAAGLGRTLRTRRLIVLPRRLAGVHASPAIWACKRNSSPQCTRHRGRCMFGLFLSESAATCDSHARAGSSEDPT